MSPGMEIPNPKVHKRCASIQCVTCNPGLGAALAPNSLTAEQQGSDESGEGLREAERGLAIWALAVELREIWRDPHRNDGHDPLSLFGDVARTVAGDVLASDWLREHAEAALATARRDADELRDRLAAVEALADEWTRHLTNEHFAPARLRAALANPSAAQGEGEVGARVLREAADQTETLRLMVRASALVVMAEVGETDKALATAIGSQAGPALTRWLHTRADSLATDADGSGQT